MANPKRYEDLPPEGRSAVDAIRARWKTPEARAEEERVRDLVRTEFPPASAPPEVVAAGAALRSERERQGLSLADVAARSGLDRAVLSKLENGRQANPTWGTLSRYAAALGKRATIAMQDEEDAALETGTP